MSPQSFFLHSDVRLMFDLPLCNARLFEEGLSIHTYETILLLTKFNHYAELLTSLGPRSRRVHVKANRREKTKGSNSKRAAFAAALSSELRMQYGLLWAGPLLVSNRKVPANSSKSGQ